MLEKFIPLAAALALTFAAEAQPSRIVTLGGDVTEIVYALGAGGRIACDDLTSVYPEAAAKLPRVGYLRTLSAEGVLSCRPDLILASGAAGPAAAMTQLAGAGVRIVPVTAGDSPEAVRNKIVAVARALDIPAQGVALLAKYDAAMARTRTAVAAYKDRPRAIFLMAHGTGGPMAAGAGSAANAMLTLAGAENAATGFHGYKPLTPEAAIALKPDVIAIDRMSLQALGGMAAFRARPEIAVTPAGRNGRIVAVDTMFVLGFGPRLPEAIATLAKALHADGTP